MSLRYYVWKYVHNGWAHRFMKWPWEPRWVQRFHAWTTEKWEASMVIYPWQALEFNGWNVIALNHFHVNGARYLYVAMNNGIGKCIVEQGTEDDFLWQRLREKALREVPPSVTE